VPRWLAEVRKRQERKAREADDRARMVAARSVGKRITQQTRLNRNTVRRSR
jgi:hypothetical protein